MEIFSHSLEEEVDVNPQDLEKPNQSLYRFKSPLTKYIMAAWKMLQFRDIEIANNVMEKVERMYKNVLNVKDKVLFKN